MRLLWRVEDDIFALATFEDKQLPPYAILSHTWVEGHEVTYDDIMIGAGKDKSDFAKLRFCSDQAAADGLQYFWIDTCCLNRASSSDLDASINSRFLWFRQAAKCYVYLADVSVPGAVDPRSVKRRWVEAFRQSEWFKQGWTLQDLLARGDIEFFSKEGKLIGTKKTLLREILGITQIPLNALKGNSLAYYSDSDKMKWAASRKNTYAEESVYCLAGILGVVLSANYGEGEALARKRLEKAIRISLDPQEEKKLKEIYAKEAHSVHLIPFRRNPYFVNPGQLLDKLEEACSKPASRVAIVGVAGVGKSELALEYCYRTIERSPKTCAFWVAADTHAKILDGFHLIARQLNIEGLHDLSIGEIFELVSSWLRGTRAPWILVLDNLEDGIYEHSDQILSGCRHGSIIITTRSRNVALKLVEQRDVVTIQQIGEKNASESVKTSLTTDGPLRDDVLALLARLGADSSVQEDALALIRILQNPGQLTDFLEYLKKDGGKNTGADCLKSWYAIEAHNRRLPSKEKSKDTESNYEIQRDDDNVSVQSIESSTTLISTFSSSTIVAKSATVELERVFQEDEELIGLYRLALKDTSMEPHRLQRNVARLLQFFAKDLRREASGQLERVASRFVQSKAQYVAQGIVERFHDTPRGLWQQLEESDGVVETLGELQSDVVEVPETQPQVNNEQLASDDVDDVAPVDEDYFEDLTMLRSFLECSSAFQLFRARLAEFVLPKGACRPGVDFGVKKRPTGPSLWRAKGFLFSTSRVFKALLVAAGCLEPPLQPGFIRLRWQCECGARLFGDVQEYRIGGVSRLIERMEKSTRGKVTATAYNKESTNQRYIPGPVIWAREMARSVMGAFSRTEKCSDTLPQHNSPGITVTPISPDVESPLPRDLLLLACMHESQGGQLLRQDSIGTMSNDRQLFCFIREQISQAPHKSWSSRFLKAVTGIHFTQFHLRLNDDVEPRLHKLCCRQDACQCVPLTSNAEYDCQPAGPLDFGPPVLPSKMLHYFQHPELIAEKEMSILNQLPKRNCGKLQSTGLAPAEGWGLYYEESWNVGLIIAVFVGLTVSASVAFGVWWTLAKADIQGAWGVSSYMITACGLVVGLVSIVGRVSGG